MENINNKSKKWFENKKIRVIYSFDKPNCVSCLCEECGSSIKRKFLLKIIPFKKMNGCININCKNFFKFK
jgi:hypothetical protein